MDEEFDFEAFLSSLEAFRVPATEIPADPKLLPDWAWPPLGTYNGFSGALRVRVWQVQRWLLDRHLIGEPERCSICGDRRQVSFHSENYFDLWTPIPLCRACHMIVHRRHLNQDEWLAFLKSYSGKRVKQWFEYLRPQPINLAKWLGGYPSWMGLFG